MRSEARSARGAKRGVQEERSEECKRSEATIHNTRSTRGAERRGAHEGRSDEEHTSDEERYEERGASLLDNNNTSCVAPLHPSLFRSHGSLASLARGYVLVLELLDDVVVQVALGGLEAVDTNDDHRSAEKSNHDKSHQRGSDASVGGGEGARDPEKEADHQEGLHEGLGGSLLVVRVHEGEDEAEEEVNETAEEGRAPDEERVKAAVVRIIASDILRSGTCCLIVDEES